MARGKYRNQVLLEELGGHDLVSAEGERDDGQVQLARSQLLLQLDAGALRHVEVDVRMADPEQVEQLRYQPAPGGADHAQPDRADDFSSHGGDVGHHGLELVHDPSGPLDHHQALFCRTA